MIRGLTIFFSLLFVSLIGLGMLFSKEFSAAYYSYRASELLNQAWVDRNSIPCESTESISENSEKQAQFAISTAEHALLIRPLHKEALLVLGRASCFANLPNKAAQAYESYLAQEPDNPLVWLEYGFALDKNGDFEASANAWKKIDHAADFFFMAGDDLFSLGNQTGAVVWFQRALTIDPNYGKAWGRLGEISEARGNYQKAADSYRHAFTAGNEQVITKLIKILINLDLYDEAVSQVNLSLEKYPNSNFRIDWYELYAEELIDHDSYQNVLQILSKGLGEFPTNTKIQLEITLAEFKESNNSTLAINKLTNLAHDYPQDAQIAFTLAEIYARSQHYTEADQWYTKAIVLSPEKKWWYIYQGRNLRNSGDNDRAIALFQSTIRRFPAFGYGYFELAKSFDLRNDLPSSVFNIQKALDLIPEPSVVVLLTSGEVFYKSGNYEQALDALTDVLVMDPDNIKAHNLINQIYTEIK